MEKLELTYLVIPNYIYKDARLSLIALKVYGFIHSYTNPFFFGNENIAKMFNCSERSVTEALAKLEEYGYIKMKHTPKSGGGTTRLAVDCYSDSQSSSSRNENSEATTSSLLLYKGKDNKKKEKFFSSKNQNLNAGGNNQSLNYRVDPKVKEARKAKKVAFNNHQPTYQKQYVKKGGVAKYEEPNF